MKNTKEFIKTLERFSKSTITITSHEISIPFPFLTYEILKEIVKYDIPFYIAGGILFFSKSYYEI